MDYGPRLVGVAASDPFGNISPICTLSNSRDTVYLCSQILDIARTKGNYISQILKLKEGKKCVYNN